MHRRRSAGLAQVATIGRLWSACRPTAIGWPLPRARSARLGGNSLAASSRNVVRNCRRYSRVDARDDVRHNLCRALGRVGCCQRRIRSLPAHPDSDTGFQPWKAFTPASERLVSMMPMRWSFYSKPARILPAIAIAASVASWSTDAPAQTANPDRSETLTLTDAEKADLLSHNTETSVDMARVGLGNGTPAKQIHGEFGAMIGTHGTRGVYGAAAIPLSDHAGATVSFESSRYGRP